MAEEVNFLNNLQTIVANSSTFQGWTGTASLAAAKSRVHRNFEVESAITKPYSLIDFTNTLPRTKIAERAYIARASLMLAFVNDYDDSNPPWDELQSFIAKTSDIIDDMLAVSGTDDGVNSFLVIDDLNISERARFNERNDQNDELIIIYEVLTGI